MSAGSGRAALRHVPRKRFGQHFLTDATVIDSIVRAIDPRPADALVEIGPGLGALTLPLLARCEALTVVELDRDLAARLREVAGLHVIEADVLQVDFGALADAATRPLRVVGNLPYNVSSPILFHLLQHADRVRDQHLMLQAEVVDRIAASPPGKAYGRLSVMLQWRYEVEPLLVVPAHAFDPPPAVVSKVVRMTPRAAPADVDPQLLADLVRRAFSQRRKLLRHTLDGWLSQRGFSGQFDTRRRAEEVPVAEYLALARELARSSLSAKPRA